MNIDINFWLLLITSISGSIVGVGKIFFNSANRKKIPLLEKISRASFSVLLVILILRSFLVGNFFIPSSSMVPTLSVGSFVIVNKMAYGIRSPIDNTVLIKTNCPARGDVIVFYFPGNPNITFIKRVIGIPGDIISYNKKRIFVNGLEVHQERYSENLHELIMTENLGKKYKIKVYPSIKDIGFSNIVVPEHAYFVMGDNRDNSEDSRFWGFVEEKALIGKASFTWFNWNSQTKSIGWNQIGKIS